MTYKEDILKCFLEKNKFLPKQGSIEWLNSRLETIGGSEISTILGLNPYQDIKKLLNQKLGITKFVKSAPLWFGTILEYPLQKYTELVFNTDVYETGSIQFEKSKYIKYSPDGISVIKKDKLKRVFKDFDIINSTSLFDNTLDINNEELIILFEFKNPYMRVIKYNEIPVYYKPQPQLGLDVIDICEASIFIESVFRFCSYNDIINKNNRYNTRYHFDRNRYNNKPIAYNAFSLYYDANNTNETLTNILNTFNEYLSENDMNEYDISNISNSKLLNSILENIVDYKDIKIIYHDMYLNIKSDYHDKDLFYFDKYNNINKFRQEVKNKKEQILSDSNNKYLGCMCYKMFNINIQPVYKSDIVNSDLLNKVESVINIIKKCKDIDCLDSKKKVINLEVKNLT
jgi:aromatic ring-cleaving dioxygenase